MCLMLNITGELQNWRIRLSTICLYLPLLALLCSAAQHLCWFRLSFVSGFACFFIFFSVFTWSFSIFIPVTFISVSPESLWPVANFLLSYSPKLLFVGHLLGLLNPQITTYQDKLHEIKLSFSITFFYFAIFQRQKTEVIAITAKQNKTNLMVPAGSCTHSLMWHLLYICCISSISGW